MNVVRDNADMFSQLPDVPPVAPKNANPRVVADDRIYLSIDRLEQGRLSATIRPENRDTFVLSYLKTKLFEYARCPSPDSRVSNV